MSLCDLSISELREAFHRGDASPAEAVEALETRIGSVDSKVAAYLSRDIEKARAEAARADLSLPLGGVPIAIKDLIQVEGEPCSCASRILGEYRAPYSATVINKLRQAGAIPFGRLNMDEFAMGSSTENSAFFPTKNPWDPDRIPGGSSGGSAAAVAAREAFAALGSDTGGSIRQPAALCGCVGLKPSYGRVSRYGMVAFASSLDQIGPLTRSIRDSALVLNALAGRDPMDSTSLDLPSEDFTAGLGREIRDIKLGVPAEYFGKGIDPQVEACVRAALRQLESLGAELVEISLPHTDLAVATYYIVATAEASSNLARFDGVRYGRRAEAPRNLADLYFRSREEGFGSEVKRRILLGTYVLSSGYYDAYYLRAQKVRTLIRRDFERAFETVDAIACPTSPSFAFPIGQHSQDPLHLYLADIFTIAANLSGICGLSIPCGFAEDAGKSLPVGLQFLGRPFSEAAILQIAHAYEQSTSWHSRKPDL